MLDPAAWGTASTVCEPTGAQRDQVPPQTSANGCRQCGKPAAGQDLAAGFRYCDPGVVGYPMLTTCPPVGHSFGPMPVAGAMLQLET